VSVPTITTIAGRQVAIRPGLPPMDLGPAQKDGKNAYQLAQQRGYGGTLDQWLASQQGRGIASISPTGLITLTDGVTQQLDLSGVTVGNVKGVAGISPSGLVSFTDGTTQQLNLPSGKGIKGISASGLVTFSDNTTQQLNLGGGTAGVGISDVSQPAAGVVRFALTDGSTKDVPLPVSTVPGPKGDPLRIVPFALGTAVVVGNLTNYSGALYPVTVAHTFGSTFDASKHGQGVALPGPASTVPGPTGPSNYALAVASGFSGSVTDYLASLKVKGNFVSTNPTASGPVLIAQGSGYVAANPNMLALLTAQLYLKGTDGNLYTDGLVPFTWPAGTAAGDRLVLQASSGGTNLLWLAQGAQIPATLNTVDNAYVELGTAGATPHTVVFRPRAPLFDGSIVRTADRFQAAVYPSVAAFEQVYTKLGVFATALYDSASAPVSGRILEINDTTATGGVYGYLRTSYPSGAALFTVGSVTVSNAKGGATGDLIAVLRATGSGSTYTALELRLNTSSGALGLYSVVNGASTPIGSSVAKGAANDAFWWLRLYVQDGTIQGRAWLSTTAEPSTWDFNTTQNAVLAAGYAGFRTSAGYDRVSFFGVSRGDALAPVA